MKNQPKNTTIILVNGQPLSGKTELSNHLKKLLEEARHEHRNGNPYTSCVICDTGEESKRRLPLEGEYLYARRIAYTRRENGFPQPVLSTAKVLHDFFDEHLSSTKDIIISGSPRTMLESEILLEFLNQAYEYRNRDYGLVFFSVRLNITQDEFRKRLEKRAVDQKRPDDLLKKAVAQRIETFEKHTSYAIDNLVQGLKIPTHRQIEINSTENTKYEVFEMIERNLFG